MADRSRGSTFWKDGDGHQFNALGGTQNNNNGHGCQINGHIGTVIVDSRSSEPLPQYLCSQSLAFREMESRSKEIDKATPGTCEWLLGHDTYKSWEQSNRGLLWIKGKPGSGKSTLLRHALNGIQADKGRDNAIVLSFFFHGSGHELQKTLEGLLRSLLHQLLSQAPVALSDLVDTFTKNEKERGKLDEKWTWHPGDLQDFFQSSIPKVLENRSVWLFVDALDESSNHAEMIKKFQSLLQGLPPTNSQFHICFSCRHGVNLDKSGEFKICLEDENREDISTYVRSQLSTSSTPSELRESEIPEIITEEARGLFIWARLAVEKVLELDGKGKGLGEIEKEIRSIPPDLCGLYRELVDQMSETEASLKLIRWICFANRSLSPDELRWALVIDATPPPQSLEECRSKDDWISNTDRMKKRVQALSRGLVEVITSSDTQVVQFIHQSVKDYFIKEGISTLEQSSKPGVPMADMEGHAHYQLSRTCIRYLAMEELGQSISDEQDDMSSEFPFLHYAATSWVAHTKRSETRNVPQDDLLDYFGWPSEELVKRWVRIYQKLDRDSDDCPPEDTSMIHLVSRHHLIEPLRMILKAGTGIDKRDGSGRTPLSWAAANGHEAVVKLLLDKGKVDIDMKDKYGRTPLSRAARNLRHVLAKSAMVKFLYDTGKVDVDAKDNYGRTPLWRAAANGQEAMVKFLYDTGKVDVDAKDNDGRTPLLWAAWGGHEAMVKLLYDTGKVDVDAKDNDGWTPLLWAAASGHEAVVKFLLDTGKVDVDVKGNDGWTPLWRAAASGQEAMVKLLYDTGKVDVDAKDNDGRTPLSLAAASGHEAVAKFL